jgi:hypothetical protein
MRTRLLLSLLGLLFTTVVSAMEIYVATDGNDAWSGALAAPNADRSDGPFATLQRAQQAARRWKSSGPVHVLVRGGTYFLTHPLQFEPEDSGTRARPVLYSAYPGERPVLSGGRLIKGWKQGPNGLWQAQLDEVRSGDWYFQQLFVNGTRRLRARAPNAGYYRIAGFLPGEPIQNAKPYARDRFVFHPGELEPWEPLNDVSIVLMHSWETSIHRIAGIDTDRNIVQFTAPMKEWWSLGLWEEAQRYYVENALALLDQPGEWHLNRTTGLLSYMPLPGEQMDSVEVIAPVLTELVRINGNPDQSKFVEHLTLRGLTFHHADWVLAQEGNSSTQAAVEVPAAVTADGARHCAIEACEVAHIGTYGIWLRRGCKDSRIQQNRLFDLGAGGIRVGEARMSETDETESSRILVDNNHIYDGGHVYPAGVGIWVAQSSENRIAHNDIHDMRYSGISIGWNWGLEPNRTHHNLVEFNHVHNLVHGELSDAGLIYCLGVSPGSVIRNNIFHDIWPYSTPNFGWGIYLDGRCGEYTVENNLVYNTCSGGVMYNNGGHGHVIRNNIFALSANHALWPYFGKPECSFERNIVLLTQGELLIPHVQHTLDERLAADDPLGTWDHNLYWHTSNPHQLRFLRYTWDQWQALGLDPHSRIADPQFIDPAVHDFTLHPDSPALELGFQPPDLTGVGLYGDPAWAGEARHADCAHIPLPPPPAPPAPLLLNDDFEGTPVDGSPAEATLSGVGDGADIRISNQRAATGEQSLMIVDSPDATPAWEPHFYYVPRLREGIVRQSFQVWFDRNAEFFTEWRDTGTYPRNIGPSLHFTGDGRISAAGRELTGVPPESWITVAIEAALGKQTEPTFTLTIRTEDGKVRAFPRLPISGEDFRELHWLGFSSTGTKESVFYVDNLKWEVIPGADEQQAVPSEN